MSSKNSSTNSTLEALQDLIRTLRGPEGCPWDRSQDFEDIKSYLVEECYEVVDALEEGSFQKLKEELGDLLFHILFLAHLAEERELFIFQDVIQGILDKMIRRHPHVFNRTQIINVREVKQNWWMIKQEERGKSGSLLDGIPRSLPALHRAFRLGRRASRVGLDWPDPTSVLVKISEECAELRDAIQRRRIEQIEEELGDLLFTMANLARSLSVNPEEALQKSNQKFIKRVQAMERTSMENGRSLTDLSPEELDELWKRVKEI